MSLGGTKRAVLVILCEPPRQITFLYLRVGPTTTSPASETWGPPPALHSAFFARFMRRNFIRYPLHSLRQPVISLRIDYANVPWCMDGHPLRFQIEGAIGDSSFHTVAPPIRVRGSAALWSEQIVPG